MTTTDYRDSLKILEDAIIDARRIERGINALVRSALLRTYEEMYHEPIKIKPFHRYFKLWCGRTAFYNLLDCRGGVSVERAIGILVSDRELRVAMGLSPNNITDEEIWVVHKLTLLSGASANLLEWLHTTRSYDTSSALQQASGTTSNEPSLSAFVPSVSESEKGTSGRGSLSTNVKRRS